MKKPRRPQQRPDKKPLTASFAAVARPLSQMSYSCSLRRMKFSADEEAALPFLDKRIKYIMKRCQTPSVPESATVE